MYITWYSWDLRDTWWRCWRNHGGFSSWGFLNQLQKYIGMCKQNGVYKSGFNQQQTNMVAFDWDIIYIFKNLRTWGHNDQWMTSTWEIWWIHLDSILFCLWHRESCFAYQILGKWLYLYPLKYASALRFTRSFSYFTIFGLYLHGLGRHTTVNLSKFHWILGCSCCCGQLP